MRIHQQTKYVNEPVNVYFGRYRDKSIAIISKSKDGEPMSTFTVCMMEYGLTPGLKQVFIKTWSENDGVLECLIREGLVTDTDKRYDAGFVRQGCALCELTPKSIEAIIEQHVVSGLEEFEHA